MRGLLMVLVAVGGVGCATTPKWASGSTLAEERFPGREELQKVALREAKLDLARHSAQSVDKWTLKGPLPTQVVVERVKPSTPWELAVTQAAPAFGAALTVDMQCIAREVAHFYLARSEYPGNSLQVFIERRCGTTLEHTRLWAVDGEVPEKMDEATWLASWRESVTKSIKDIGKPGLSGVGVVRDGKRGVVVLAWGTPEVELSQPVQLVGTNGSIVVRGRLTKNNVERVDALINKGAVDVAECKTLDVAKPPEFAFECPVDARDVRTTLAVGSFESGRILGSGVATFTLWPSGKALDTWERPADSVEVPKGEFNAQFLGAVNRLRQRTGLPLLSEAKLQTVSAMALAPHYFAAHFGEGEALDADRIALGMMAGWDVGTDIVSSGFGNAWLSGSRDLSVFMDFALDDPFQRKAITEPRATLFAIGSIDNVDNAMGAIFATYVPMGAFDRKDAEEAIITRLNQLRIDRKLGLAQWTLWPEDVSAFVEAKLKARAWDPDEALQHVLDKTVEVAKGRVTGYVQLVDDLDNFQFPPEVLMRSDVNVFLSVGTYRDARWAQSRYVVCFVLASTGDIETASR